MSNKQTTTIRRNAPLRQYKAPTLCKSCVNILERNCEDRYDIIFKYWWGHRCIEVCTGYQEQVV